MFEHVIGCLSILFIDVYLAINKMERVSACDNEFIVLGNRFFEKNFMIMNVSEQYLVIIHLARNLLINKKS